MSNPTQFSLPIAELFFQAWCSGKLAADERYSLQAALLADGIDKDELRAIDRLIHAVRRGWLEMEPTQTRQNQLRRG